ncbi:ADP-ribosylglycohydrolase family protein [Amycolatopsis sp. CA-230715]|uniref:ADP-ribosylglycohydrolase family protein n=1 Tax=Amycolatopsis sp. CA-230715 TaxID=2745196 RepID=UPI001C01AA57|nr:ADP-ribosylglycohydrolase family protein [Amycolatopsis sp. CA-230715]QWF76727.1 hypothetical protein HUW46_00103 [Amycolatopsis sp. CA-230715]
MTQLDAAASLRGLAVGDAFGSRMALPGDHPDVLGRRPPPSPWQWSDDTEMACSVLSVLTRHGEVEQDALAASFAERYDASRGYGSGAERMLLRYRAGEHWADVAPAAFGTGSWGNGGAMRVAPLGAWFGHDLDLAAAQAARSAVVTHAHPEGIAGAVAVAVAAAVLTKDPAPHPAELLGIVASRVPAGEVQRGIAVASAIRGSTEPASVAAELGTGRAVSAVDTVPLALWLAAQHVDRFADAMWTAARVAEDLDTVCAIVGGVLGARNEGAAIPEDWANACEPLPAWLT